MLNGVSTCEYDTIQWVSYHKQNDIFSFYDIFTPAKQFHLILMLNSVCLIQLKIHPRSGLNIVFFCSSVLCWRYVSAMGHSNIYFIKMPTWNSFACQLGSIWMDFICSRKLYWLFSQCIFISTRYIDYLETSELIPIYSGSYGDL